MKEFNDFLMKFSLNKDKLRMEISLDDLISLFDNHPNNMDEYGNYPGYKIKSDMKQKFAEYVIRMLLDDAPNERDNIRIGEPFDDIFEEIMEVAKIFVNILIIRKKIKYYKMRFLLNENIFQKW